MRPLYSQRPTDPPSLSILPNRPAVIVSVYIMRNGRVAIAVGSFLALVTVIELFADDVLEYALLRIALVPQQHEFWCYAASAEMAAVHYVGSSAPEQCSFVTTV